MEELRLLTINELKKEIVDNLEYEPPTNNPFDFLSDGLKPIIDEKVFRNEYEAVEYIFQTSELYKNIRKCSNNIKIIENYDENKDSIIYTIYKIDEQIIKKNILSIKFGDYEAYEFVFKKNMFIILDKDDNEIRCINIKNDKFQWSNYENIKNNFFDNILIPLKDMKLLLEYLWLSWKNNVIDDEKLEEELISLIDWINTITKTKPSSDFWGCIF